MHDRIGPYQTPERGTDNYLRRLYVLKGNGGRVSIGTCGVDEMTDILKSTYRDNGLHESDYFLSTPVTNSPSYLEELRKYCAEHGEEISPNVYVIDFLEVTLFANSLIPGGWL